MCSFSFISRITQNNYKEAVKFELLIEIVYLYPAGALGSQAL
jgi:hypothetical protein